MIFGAYSSKVVRWYTTDASSAKDCKAIYIGTGKQETTFSGVIDILEAAAGSASICLIAYQGRRNVSWRNATRSQSHLCNALPGTWDMPNYNQGNGRATGDSKALLKQNTGRDYITYLGNKWDHMSDLGAEAWVEEIAKRMSQQGMCLKEAADAERHPFPPECNFDLGRLSRPSKAGPSQHQRRYTPEGLPYSLHLTAADPHQQQLQERLNAACAGKTKRSLEAGTTSLTLSAGLPEDLYSLIDISQQQLLTKARAVSEEVIADNGSTHDMYALPLGSQMKSDSPQLAEVKAGEAREPVLLTQLQIWSMHELALGTTLEQAQKELQQDAKGRLPEHLRRALQPDIQRGVRFCWRHIFSKLLKDARQFQHDHQR